jgi:hypothetical protein
MKNDIKYHLIEYKMDPIEIERVLQMIESNPKYIFCMIDKRGSIHEFRRKKIQSEYYDVSTFNPEEICENGGILKNDVKSILQSSFLRELTLDEAIFVYPGYDNFVRLSRVW